MGVLINGADLDPCPCGRPVKYMIGVGLASCNKYVRCATDKESLIREQKRKDCKHDFKSKVFGGIDFKYCDECGKEVLFE